ncbi:MAG: dihydroneopterin aldolase [Tannerella sp.]|jgi:dihydroneopterin aldolase|nr:dihydroneopterin aldolase [Tannerella sp.]
MNITIELNAMKFYAYHGVLHQETKVGNYFVVDITYACPCEKACLSDDLNDTISYQDVYSVVKTEMAKPSKLLEHVVERIANVLKLKFPQLTYLKIKLFKLNPPLGGEVQSASVTIEKKFAISG